MNITKKITLPGIAAFIILLSIGFKPIQSRSDFSGRWNINKEKCDFGGLPPERAGAESITIIQSSDSIHMERLFTGKPVNTETLSFDGKAKELAYPGTIVTRALVWSGDGKTITIDSKYKVHKENEEPWEYTRTETYTLVDDGKVLILERISVTLQATEKVKAIYNKQ